LLTRTLLAAALLLLAGLLAAALLATAALLARARIVLLLLTRILVRIVGVRHSFTPGVLTRLLAPEAQR